MKSRQSLARVPAALRSFVSSSYRTAGSGQTPMVDLSLRTAEEADYQDAINVLNQYQRHQPSAKRSQDNARERTKRWLRLLDCDVDHLNVIHVAGSKGKGTACYFCNHILNEHRRTTGEPKKIGCYTSPHQLDVRDRFLINNKRISKQLFSHYVRELHNRIRYLTQQPEVEAPRIPIYPGFLALLAMYIFVLEKFDVVVLETGIGGETDSTNVFPHPIATGITTIGLDHVQVLGDTVEKIAWHKAGIFKPGSPAFAVEQDEAILNVFRKRAEEINVVGKLQIVTDEKVLPHGLKLNPDMRYQRLNAALAMSLAETYLKSEYPHFTMTDEIARSLHDTVLPGRSEVIMEKDNTWYISIAHNEISLKETVAWFKGTVEGTERTNAHRVLMFNYESNNQSPRDPYSLLEVIHEGLCADNPASLQGVIFCTDQSDETGKEKPDLIDLRTDRKLVASLKKQRENAEIWKQLGGSGDITVVHTIKEAVCLVREKYRGAEVLVTGSSLLASGLLHLLQATSLGENAR